jgi:hypothetical protein
MRLSKTLAVCGLVGAASFGGVGVASASAHHPESWYDANSVACSRAVDSHQVITRKVYDECAHGAAVTPDAPAVCVETASLAHSRIESPTAEAIEVNNYFTMGYCVQVGKKPARPKPPPTAAEVAFIRDLAAVDSADKDAAASLTTFQANQAAGVAQTQAQVLTAIAPVTAALTTAVSDLTALIPTLPANMTSAAQEMSSTLSDVLEVYQLATSTTQTEESLPYSLPAVNAALTESLIADLQADVSERGTLIAAAEHDYAEAMVADYSNA